MEIDCIFPLRIFSYKKSTCVKISNELKRTFIPENIALE